MNKVERLLAEGRVHISRMDSWSAEATVEGDTGTYAVRVDTRAGRVVGRCVCPSGLFRGRCSHIQALERYWRACKPVARPRR